MSAYYNEYDRDAASTLRELIAEGLIADGVVDDRSIELVKPSDLKGFAQVHLFAGFGIWSLAAREAGWRDDRPLWTASCPCPPFSSAGKSKACPECDGNKPIPDVRRTGAFLCVICGHSWLADQRHLWPEVWRLVRDERPPCIVGEQVASADGRTWLDLVRASLEILAYDAWGVDTCAAGFGAPHIRSRLYWVADDASGGRGEERPNDRGSSAGDRAQGDATGPCGRGDVDRLADAEDADGRRGERGTQEGIGAGEQRRRGLASGGALDGLVDPQLAGLEGLAGNGDDGDEPRRIGTGQARSASAPSAPSGVADAHGQLAGEAGAIQRGGEQLLPSGDRGVDQAALLPGPVNGLWRDTDWLGCTDGCFRPVESGTFPLVAARTFRNRVAALRGAGNAINLAQATEFIRAIMPELPD